MENKRNLNNNFFISKQEFEKAKKEFKISDDYGFLTYYDYDLVKLPDFLLAYEEIASNIHNLIKENKVQSAINSLEKIRKEEVQFIKDEKILQKIFCIATFLTNAYLFSNKYAENEKAIIPANLWEMLKHSANSLELNPVFILWGPLHVLKRLDKNVEPTFDNIQMQISFTKTITEKYFLECNYLFEYYLKDFIQKTFDINFICWQHVKDYNNLNCFSLDSPIKDKMQKLSIKAQDCLDNDNNNNNKDSISEFDEKSNKNNKNEKDEYYKKNQNDLTQEKINHLILENENENKNENNADNENSEKIDFNYEELTSEEINFINQTLKELQIAQKKVIEFCKLLFTNMDATVFFNELRLFLRGYSAFADGVQIEGSNEVLRFSGSSAGQDPMITLMKLFFGIGFTDNMKNYHKNLMDNIRKPHLDFLQIVEKYSIIHKLQNHKDIKENFEASKNLLLDFYKVHKAYILKFISGPAKQLNMNPDELYGVGDTPINIVKNIHNYFVNKK